MSRLEVQVKFAKPKKEFIEGREEEESAEDKAYREAERIIAGKQLDEEEKTPLFLKLLDDKNYDFYYKPYCFKINEVSDFYPYDEEHVMILTEFGGSLPVKMSWDIWKATWEHFSGEVINIAKPVEIEPSHSTRQIIKRKNNE